jgi:cation transport regulator
MAARAAPIAWRAEKEEPMPYASNSDLPPSVATHLPSHAQDIYREAFNHAFAAHQGDPRQEEAAHRIAWAAVKRGYVKLGDQWVPRGSID